MAFLVLSPVVAKPYVPTFEEEETTPVMRERADSVSSVASNASLRDTGFKPLRLQQ